jgi:hypothetical protein
MYLKLCRIAVGLLVRHSFFKVLAPNPQKKHTQKAKKSLEDVLQPFLGLQKSARNTQRQATASCSEFGAG